MLLLPFSHFFPCYFYYHFLFLKKVTISQHVYFHLKREFKSNVPEVILLLNFWEKTVVEISVI